MLGKYLQQTTSANDIFRCIFFLGALMDWTSVHCIFSRRALRAIVILITLFRIQYIVSLFRRALRAIFILIPILGLHYIVSLFQACTPSNSYFDTILGFQYSVSFFFRRTLRAIVILMPLLGLQYIVSFSGVHSEQYLF